MVDFRTFPPGKSIRSNTGAWYRKVQALGTGKNATTILVYCTEGPHRGILFALKAFQRLSSDESRERFLRESAFLSETSHPAIMKVFDAGNYADPDGTYPFVVAEYLPQTLADVIAARNASMVEKAGYAMQLVSALRFLVGLDPSVIHRDIKPANIFVKGKSCVLGDFGLLKREHIPSDEDRNILRESLGAVMPSRYRTPDLVAYARGESEVTAASDAFQLGITLTELFTGINPVKPPADILDDVEVNTIPEIPGSHGGLIATTLKKMLEIVPSNRPTPDQLIDHWSLVFDKVSDQARDLNGTAF